METKLETNPNLARVAAATFLFVCMPTSIWSQTYVLSKLFVAQDPAATAANILSNEFSFRMALVLNLAGSLVFAWMTFTMYRIFEPVNRTLGLMMALPIAAQVAVAFLLESINFTALTVLKSEPRPGFGVADQQEAAYLLLRLYRASLSCDKIVLALSILPWGALVWRSGIVPRIFGVLLIISGIGYVLDTITGLLLDRSIVVVIRPYLRGAFVGYIATMLWLLIRGVGKWRPVPA